MQTLTNARRIPAKMVVLVLIPVEAIRVTVLKVTREITVGIVRLLLSH